MRQLKHLQECSPAISLQTKIEGGLFIPGYFLVSCAFPAADILKKQFENERKCFIFFGRSMSVMAVTAAKLHDGACSGTIALRSS